MAAVTGAITALAGIGMSAYQAYEASEQQKDAQAAAKAAKQALKSISEQNPYADVQAPDISSLAFDQLARSEAGAINALQGLGAEGAAQVVNVLQSGKEASLQTAQNQGNLEFQRNAAEAEAQKDINMRKAMRDTGIASGELQGAQQAAAAAKAQQQQSLMNTVAGVGSLASGIGQATSLEAKAGRNERRQGTSPTTTTTKTTGLSQAASTASTAVGAGSENAINNIYASLEGDLNQILNAY